MPDPADLANHADDPLWYKDAIVYQTHVKAFFDTNGDGNGDFRGLTEKLDYVQALGVNTIWLLPFYPSPMRDDGYDIADYRNVHPAYGSRRDFRRFINAAHERGIRVIVELIINHTSDQHPWFQAARRAPRGSRKRDFYVWSDDNSRFSETRIIFTDSEASNWTWDPVAEQYYWHRFFSHQPDLNHNNPHVVKAVIRVMRFWLDLGVDGLRLDAIPYLCVRDGTSNENLPETHAVIKQMRAVVDAHYRNRMFLAEANQWPEDVRDYFGDSDECHVAYHFPLMPRMYMALAQEDRHPIVEIMEQTPEIPADCQWALFLRNHDELTLEMVSDRERDYMYQTYATDPRMRVNVGIRRRLAPLLGNNQDKIRLMYSLLLSMPGSPILYYGDELGMGDNIYLGDRNAVRTPMQWTPDRNAGFSRADPERLYLPPIMDAVYGYQSVNAEAQARSSSSLLNWMRRIIAVRKAHRVFGRGSIEFLHPGNRKVLAYVREATETELLPSDAPEDTPVGTPVGTPVDALEDNKNKQEVVLCVANLARGAQPVELDLARFQGRVPIELLGRTPFPPIGELPYLLTLAGHGFYWFLLSDEEDAPAWHDERLLAPRLATLVLPEGWRSLRPDLAKRADPTRRARELLEDRILPAHLRPRFQSAGPRVAAPQPGGSKPAAHQAVGRRAAPDGAALRAVRLSAIDAWRDWLLTLVTLDLSDGNEAQLLLPLWLVWQTGETALTATPPAATTLSRVRRHATPGLLCDALADQRFVQAMLELIGDQGEVPLGEGVLAGEPTNAFERLCADCSGEPVRVPREDHGHSAALGDRLLIQIRPFRALEAAAEEPATDPSIEVRRYLTEVAGFANAPALAGSVSYRRGPQAASTVAVLEEYVHNQGNLHDFTLALLSRLCAACGGDTEAWWHDAAYRSYEALIGMLGRRLAELHRALANAETPADPAFTPEPVSAQQLRTWAAGRAETVARALNQLERERAALPDALQPLAEGLLEGAAGLREPTTSAAEIDCDAMRTRVHGNPALSQLLVAENDILFIGFGGDWRMRPEARREKRCPLSDVARVIHSFHEVADEARLAACADAPRGTQRQPLVDALSDWRTRICSRFLEAYRQHAGIASQPGPRRPPPRQAADHSESQRARQANPPPTPSPAPQAPQPGCPQQEAALTRLWALHSAAEGLLAALHRDAPAAEPTAAATAVTANQALGQRPHQRPHETLAAPRLDGLGRAIRVLASLTRQEHW